MIREGLHYKGTFRYSSEGSEGVSHAQGDTKQRGLDTGMSCPWHVLRTSTVWLE